MEAIAKKAYLKTLALEKISNRKKEILAIADGLLLSKKALHILLYIEFV